MEDLKQYIKELESSNSQKTGLLSSPITMISQSEPELISLRTKNTELMQKIAETEKIVHSLQQENETRRKQMELDAKSLND